MISSPFFLNTRQEVQCSIITVLNDDDEEVAFFFLGEEEVAFAGVFLGLVAFEAADAAFFFLGGIFSSVGL